MAVITAGCASYNQGKHVEADDASWIVAGETTRDEVISRLGEPQGSGFGTYPGGGVEMLSYSGASVNVNPETYIPLVGAFIGGSETKITSLDIYFDDNGVVTSRAYNTTRGESGFGH